MMEDGKTGEKEMVTIPGWEAMWDDAPESITQSEDGDDGVREMVLKAFAREWESQGDGAGGGACWKTPRGGGGA
jgi:hypothetical protein